jgi:hypothetical protein
MRSLARASCAVLLLGGCVSEPLDAPVTGEETTAPVAPSGASRGNFQPIGAYPAGPYGAERGAVIEDLSFIGWHDPVRAGFDLANLERVGFSDFYDPNGTETELIVLNASAVWCPACRLEMATIDQRDMAAAYRASKVAIVGTLFEDRTGAPAKPEDLVLWASQLNFTVDFPLVLDPALQLGPYFSQSVTPLNLVIDARTMKILQVYMGYSEGLWLYVDSELEARGITPPAL